MSDGGGGGPQHWNTQLHPVLAGTSGTCLLLSAMFCAWAICHLCRAGPDVRRKLFWKQLLVLSCTDLISSLMHGMVFPVGVKFVGNADSPDRRTGLAAILSSTVYWNALVVVDFLSCLVEVQIAAGFAAASSRSPRFASILRWTLPISFVAAFCLGCMHTSMRDKNWKAPLGLLFVEKPDRGNYFWSGVVLCCCFVIAGFCMYSVVRARAALGPIQRRGLVRGVSYVVNAIITWVPIATVGTMAVDENRSGGGFWWHAKSFANYAFFLNGAANVSFYVFWMWRSRRLQERFQAEGRVRDCESYVLDTYFDVACDRDAESLQAMRLAAEAVAMVRVAEEGLENVSKEAVERKP